MWGGWIQNCTTPLIMLNGYIAPQNKGTFKTHRKPGKKVNWLN